MADLIPNVLNWVGDNLPWTPIGRGILAAREQSQIGQMRALQMQGLQFDLEQGRLAQEEYKRAREGQDRARTLIVGDWQPTANVPVTPMVGAPNYQAARQQLDQIDVGGSGSPGIIDSLPKNRQLFLRGLTDALGPAKALEQLGNWDQEAGNKDVFSRGDWQPTPDVPITPRVDAPNYGQSRAALDQTNLSGTGTPGFLDQFSPQQAATLQQISRASPAQAAELARTWLKPAEPEKPTPRSAIAQLHQDYKNGLIDEDQYRLGMRGIQAEITQRERGPLERDRAPAGVVNLQMPDGRVRAFRQDDPQLDAALRSGAFEVSSAAPSAASGPQDQAWRGVPFARPRGNLPPAVTQYIPKDADYSSAVGIGGTIQNAANRALDAIGLDPYFTNNMQATEALNTLELQTRTMLQDALPGRPSNYLMQEFDRLVAKPNTPWRGRAGAETRLQQTRDLLATTADQIERELQSPANYTRGQAGQMRTKATQLRGLQKAYEQILERGGMAGKTSGSVGGVGWRIVE